MIKLKIYNQFGRRALRKSSVGLRKGEIVFKKIMKNAGFRTCIEIGTYKGASAAVMSRFCDRVITIDLREGRLEQVDPEWSRFELWKYLGIDNIELVLLDNDSEKDFLNEIEFDFAFIDGSHSWEGVKKDFNLVKKCGRVLFHDYDYTGVPGHDDVYDFVNSIDYGSKKVYDNIFAYWTA